MKKHLLLLVGLFMAVSPGNRTAEASVFADQESFVIAKAVKLGRGSSSAFSGQQTIAPPAQGTKVKLYECETNEECPTDKKCMGYKCVDVCTQPTGNGISYARICAGKKCILDPDTPHAFKCVDSCYNISCKSGYTTELTSNGCCCVPSSCPSGQRVEGYACVNNCAGVNCINGYFAVSSSKGCCCEPLTISGVVVGCSSGYKLVNGTCVEDTPTCPENCSVCSNGTCTKCQSGFQLSNSGSCVATSVNIDQLEGIDNPLLNNGYLGVSTYWDNSAPIAH